MPQFKTANVFKRWNDVWHLLFGLQTLQLEYLSLKVKENKKKSNEKMEGQMLKKTNWKNILKKENFFKRWQTFRMFNVGK